MSAEVDLERAVPRLATQLFDPGQFQAELALKSSPVAAFKKALRQADTVLNKQFLSLQTDIRELVEARAWFIDQLLNAAWSHFNWPSGERIALLAVGGYGRGELHPHSDIDILLLLAEPEQESLRDAIEGFLTLLWDIGLEVGQSVRCIDECMHEAREDLTIITNLIESRTLAGSDHLRQHMLEVTGPDHMWSSRDFFLARHEAQKARHAKYNDTEYNLEPNVKSSPGGLRDTQTVLWVARRQFGTLDLHPLVSQGFLTEGEHLQLSHSQSFLWTVRYALHLATNRAENRLLFDYQRQIAVMLGYQEEQGRLAVERFMQDYYRTVMSVSVLTDLILQHFEEVLLCSDDRGPITRLNNRFQVRNGYLEVVHPEVFWRTPFAMLEMFVLLAQHPEIQDVRAGTLRLLRESVVLIDESFRHDIRNTSLFMELFRSHDGIHRNLRRMNRFGVLGRYLPEFGQIIGQMQYDLFHIYTVDAHTLNLIKHMRKMRNPGISEKFPLVSKILERLPKPELLYLAGLYHDIGKGRGGDHSELGAEDALAFGRRHRLPKWDIDLIAWLVRNHLVMSSTAQRQDISDPEVIHNFACHVGNQIHLDYLYALTVADIHATNPVLWTTWRASLLRQLYTVTRRALQRGLEHPLNREEQIRDTQRMALRCLVEIDVDQDEAEQLWAQLGDDYFLRHSASEIAWHTRAILQHRQPSAPLVLIRETTEHQFEGATQIFIYAPDQHDFFAVTVAAMAQLNLSIQDARILTSTSQFTLDTYIVLESDGSRIGADPQRIEEIRHGLIEALKNSDDYPSIIQRRVPRQLKHFAFPPQVTLFIDAARQVSVLELIAPDRPGLLARLGRIFLQFDIAVQNAKILTLGERVEDIFFITDGQGAPLSDPVICEQLKNAIVQQLSESNGTQIPANLDI